MVLLTYLSLLMSVVNSDNQETMHSDDYDTYQNINIWHCNYHYISYWPDYIYQFYQVHITKSNGLGEFPSVVMYFDGTFLKTVSLFCWGVGSQDARILVTPQDDDSFFLGSNTFPLPFAQYQSKQRMFFTQLAQRCVQYFRGNISSSWLCFFVKCTSTLASHSRMTHSYLLPYPGPGRRSPWNITTVMN